MKKVGQEGGYLLVEEDNKYHFLDTLTHSLYIARFVFLLLMVVFLANSIVQFVMGNLILGVILAFLEGAVIALFIVSGKTRKKRETLPQTLGEFQGELKGTLDLKNGAFISPQGDEYKLSDGKFKYPFSMTSSAGPLCFMIDKHKFILANANPLMIITRPFEFTLKKLGIQIG